MVFMAIMFAILSGCSSLVSSLTPVETAKIFDIIPVQETLLKGQKVAYSLSLSEPKSSHILDSNKILVKPSPAVIQYYDNIIWSDRIPRLIHRRMIQAFEDSQRIRSVGARTDGLDTHYDLVMEIRDFHIEPSDRVDVTSKNPIRVKVTIFSKLISERSARVVRSTKIIRVVEIEVETRENIALAFNKAFEGVAVSLLNWTLR